jgi:hypothetical protein
MSALHSDAPMTSDFERQLELGLHELFDPYLAETPRPRRAARPRRTSVRLAGGVGGALVAKLAMGAVVAALAAGAGVEAVSTHSLNPVDWGKAVSRQVQSVQPQTASSPTAHAAASPTAAGHSPAAKPAASPNATASVSPPVLSTPALPTVSPIALPTVNPTTVPKLP